MKVFHQDHARKKRIAIGMLATSVLASVFSLAPAAHAQPNWIDVVQCDEEELIEAVEEANDDGPGNPISTIKIKKKNCDFEFSRPYDDFWDNSALPYIEEDLRIIGNGADMEADEDSPWSFRFVTIGGPSPIDMTFENVTIEDFTLSIPQAEDTLPAGAAILNDTGGITTLKKVSVKDNTLNWANDGSVDFGGLDAMGGAGIASLGGTVILRDSTVSGNEVNLMNSGGEAVLGGAGGIGVDGDEAPGGGCGDGGNDCGVDLSKSTVKGNKVNVTGALGSLAVAAAGGLSVVDGAELTMDRSTVSSNRVNSSSNVASFAGAGGILLDDSELVHEIARSTVKGNRAHAEGNGPDGTGAIAGGILNLSDPGGGLPGLLVDHEDEFAFQDIEADDNDKTSISDNEATCEDICLAAGGGYANSDPFTEAGDPDGGMAVFNNTVFKDNDAEAEDGLAVGGGLALALGFTEINGGSITKNEAEGVGPFEAGGGIFLYTGGDPIEDFVDVDGTDFSKNEPDDCFAYPQGEFVCPTS